MYRIVPAIMLLCVLLAVGASRPAPAGAAHGQTVYFEAPRDLLDPATREDALDQINRLGAKALRVVLYWQSVAPDADATKRPDFVATDPRAYRWGQYDALLAAAQKRGMAVLLTVSGPVPRWATAGARDHVTRPNAREFGQFMTAIGRHYGSQVTTWSIWNEPNHPQYLDPQYVGHKPASPFIYRALVQAGVDGLHAAGLTNAQVLMGETAPRGTTHDVAPLVFLRDTLCLTARYRLLKSCSALPVDGYAHHAYTTTVGPSFKPPSRDDVTIGVLSRLVRALDAAARARAVPHRLNIYLTEFGIQSKPNPYLGVPLAKQAEYRNISERIAYSNPRVVAFSQYLLRDDIAISKPGSGIRGGTIGFQSGLRLANGKPKPSYEGFRLPLAVRPAGGGVSLWGLVRPSGGPTTAQVQYIDRGSKSWRNLLTVHTGADGSWIARSIRRSKRRWRVQWTAPGGAVFTGPPIRAY